jgi:hypothetical protein
MWQTVFAGVRVSAQAAGPLCAIEAGAQAAGYFVSSRRPMTGALNAILFALAVLAVRPFAEAQQGRPVNIRTDSGKTIASLRQVADDLDNAVKRFQTHLDREISMHDRGYRTKDGRRIPGADADFNTGQADVVQAAMRKLFAGRMISARRPGYEPVPLADSDRIQVLIAEARVRIESSNEIMRRLLVVSAKELNPRTFGEQKAEHDELLKARNAAAEAANRAFVALPVGLPEADSAEQQRERAWDAMAAAVMRVRPDVAIHMPRPSFLYGSKKERKLSW